MTAQARGDLRRRACLLLLLCAPTAAPAAADYRTNTVEGLRITFDSDWVPRAAPGYYPVRFEISNLGEARLIEIRGLGSRFIRRGHRGQPASWELRYPLRLARGDRIRLTVPVPIFADSENLSFQIREDDRILERFSYTGTQSNVDAVNASAVIVASSSGNLGRAAAGLARTGPTGGSYGAMLRGSTGSPIGSVMTSTATPTLDVVLAPSRLPSTWLGYTSVRAVLLGPVEWKELADDQRTALLEWSAGGGDLVFVDGTFDALVPGGSATTGTASASAVRGYLFGRLHFPTLQALSDSGLNGFLAEAKKTQDSNWALPANSATDWGKIAGRGFLLPIPNVGGVPARAYLGLLLVFSFLIGPLNYWFLRRQGKPVLFVLTAPIISAVFLLLLGGYVVAGEGIGVRGRAASFTMLDEARKLAVTRASVTLYAAGMSPSGGLRFPRSVAVFPLGYDGNGSQDALELDLAEQQQFRAGLIRARAPSNFEQIGIRTARERLAFRRDSSGLSVVNGFDATINALMYQDGQTLYQLAGPLPAGQSATLAPATATSASLIPVDHPLSSRLNYLVNHQPPGTYLAFLERSPFWHPGVAGVEERGSFHVVLGWPGGQP